MLALDLIVLVYQPSIFSKFCFLTYGIMSGTWTKVSQVNFATYFDNNSTDQLYSFESGP